MNSLPCKTFWALLFIFSFQISVGQQNNSPSDNISNSHFSDSGDTAFTNFVEKDPIVKVNYNIRKRNLIIGNALGTVATFAVLNNVWYSDYPRSSFHFLNDNSEYLQMDKISHAWGNYHLSHMAAEMWKWGGLSDKKSILMGGLTSISYFSIMEVLDGLSAQWGFSCGDMLSNISGSALFVSQGLIWNDQRIKLKLSMHVNDYSYSPQLLQRVNNFYGKDNFSRIMKDYNAETYWLSINLKSFFKKSNLPEWLSVSLGYGAANMYGSDQNIWFDAAGNLVDRSDLQRYRRFHIAPDIDLTKIKTKSKFLKTTFYILNGLKFPTPSLEYSQGKIHWNWLMF